MELSKIRQQVVRSVFKFSYRKEAGLSKYLKINLIDGSSYNCTDIDLRSTHIQLNQDNTSIYYSQIKSIEIF